MPSTRELRRHIRSIRSTRQITRAMEMVAASKLRRASEAAVEGRPYNERLKQLIRDAIVPAQRDAPHPLLLAREVKRTVLVVVSSDRGLAGAYNANVVKAAVTFVATEKQAGRQVVCITLGSKAERALQRFGIDIIQSYAHSSTRPTVADVLPITRSLAALYTAGECDQALVLSTEFRSAFHQVPTLAPLLPLNTKDLGLAEAPTVNRQFVYEPTTETILDALIPRYLATVLYQYLQESLASEHAARRMAMHNATDNANDLLDHLHLTYNNVRQNSITRELAELSANTAAAS
jgi:F-type H+-transporting ATPase subunit gamma